MSTKFSSILFLFICAFIFSCCRQPEPLQPADLVIKNAKIVTIDKDKPRAEAVAFQGERIIAVTSNSDISRYIEEETTRIIDAEGRLIRSFSSGGLPDS